MGRRQGKEGAGKGEGGEGEWVGVGGKKRGKIKIKNRLEGLHYEIFTSLFHETL